MNGIISIIDISMQYKKKKDFLNKNICINFNISFSHETFLLVLFINKINFDF